MKHVFSLLLALTVGSVSAAVLTQGVAHFKDQPYWCGKAKVVTVDGKKVLELSSTAKNGREFGRAFAIYGAKEPFAAKEKIVATATVKGNGKFFIGILKYRPKSGAPNTVFVEPIDLTETAREVKFVFEIEDTYDRVFPFFHIPGKGNAVIESFKLEKVNDPALKVSKVTSAAGNAPAASKAPTASAAPQNKVLLKNVTSFYDQPYWSGKAKKITENGKKILEITPAPKGGRTFGRAFAPFWSKDLFLPETKLQAIVKVRGKGKFAVGLLKYRPKQGSPALFTANPVDLADVVKEFKFDFEIEDLFDRVYPFMEVQGDGIAYVESFRLEKINDKSVKVKAITPLQIVVDKQTAKPVEFSTSIKNGDVCIVKFGAKNTVEKVKSGTDGKVVVPAAQYPLGTNQVFVSSKGMGMQSYVSVVSAEEYAKSDAIAKQIKLAKPMRILMIGDSLSDFYRGYNYVDRLNFWINKYNPGKFTFHNAGVGGDYLERSSNRMEKELKHSSVWIYRQEMYSGIFKDEYDYIFIFLGQNDTRCVRSQGYKVPETTPEEQNKYLSLMLKRLKEHCPSAKVVLLSPSPSDENLFKQREATWAKGREIHFYGKSEFVNAYDANNRTFCKANNLEYIDVLSVMRSHSPIKDLYVVDGIHLSDKGGMLIADEILKFFAKDLK